MVRATADATPPSARLAPFSPPVTFREFRALEETNSVLRIATTTNPFLGRNEVALDTQMHGRGGAADSFVDYLFYFSFPPPIDCLNGSSEAFEKACKEAGGKDDVLPDMNIRTDCEHAPILADFYSWELSPGVIFQSTNGRKQAGGTLPEFYFPPMEKLEANGMTFLHL